MSLNKEKSIEASWKSMDTEEFIDIHFYRPIGYRWALFFNKLGVTPNAITIASIFLGVGAGICFYFNDLRITGLGILLLVWANMYDSADGQLARLTGQKSELGRILDGFSGDLWFLSIYVAICLRLTPEPLPFLSGKWGLSIWILALAAGILHSNQACMADYYRNIHLFFLKGESGSELANSTQQKQIYTTLSFRKNPIKKVFQFFYKAYTAKQEKYSPQFQELFHCIRHRYGNTIPTWFREEFRKGSLPLMKYTNILTFNTRAIVLCVSLLFGVPWVYFLFEIVILQPLFYYMIHRHESLCRDLMRKLKNEQ